MANSRLIVVLGMHRSGTSAVTRALQVLNVDLGDRLSPGAEDNNPKGFFEDTDILNLNVEMLHALGIRWFSLTSVDDHDVQTLQKKGYFLRAVELLKSKCQSFPVFAFKDPRIAKLLPFWKAVFDHCQADVFYVVAVRHPRSVAKSLSQRDDFDLEKGYLLWLDHVIKIMMFTKEDQCVYIDYDKLIETPDAQVKRLATALRLQVNATKLKSFKSEFLDRNLRHTAFTLSDLDIDTSCPPLVRDIYGALVHFADALFQKSGRLVESQLTQWVAEFSRLKATLVYVDRLVSERSAIALKLFRPTNFLQVFFDVGAGFQESDSVRIEVLGTAAATEFALTLPQIECLLSLRVDPLDDFVVIRKPAILLIDENNDVSDLLPFSRPEAIVSAEGVYFFHTQDPAIYFDVPAEMLNTAKRLKITFTYEATGATAQNKYKDFCNATRERELQQSLSESQYQMQQLESSLKEKAGAAERQLADENQQLVTQHLDVEKELREAQATHRRETQQRSIESQEQLRQLEREFSERASAIEHQLAQKNELLIGTYLQVEKELRESHAARERELQERLHILLEEMQQLERGLNDKARTAERQLAEEKTLLVMQYSEAADELRKTHAAREGELQENLLISQDQFQQLERQLGEKALATERQFAQEKALLAQKHTQAEIELRNVYATGEQHLYERLLAARDNAQQMERDLNDRFRERELVQAEQVAQLNVQSYAMQAKLYERLLDGQEQIQKLEYEWSHKLAEQEHRQLEEVKLARVQFQSLQEKLQIAEHEQAITAARCLQVEKELVNVQAIRERELHERLLAGQELLLKVERDWSAKASEMEQIQAKERIILNQQLEALQEETHSNKLENQLLLIKHLKTEGLATELAGSQDRTAKALQNLTEQYCKSIRENNIKIKNLKSTWFWRLFASLSLVARNFNIHPEAVFIDSIDFVGHSSIRTATIEPEERVLPAALNLDQLICHQGADLIKCAYLTLLLRKPDQEGFEYYSNRLLKTGDKLGIIFQIYYSPERKRLGTKIPGLAVAMRWQRIKRFSVSSRLKKYKEEKLPILNSIRHKPSNVTQIKAQSSLKSSELERPENTENLSRLTAATTSNKHTLVPFSTDLHGGSVAEAFDLSESAREDIRQIFLAAPQLKFATIHSYFMQKVENKLLQSEGFTFTRLMLYVWNSRLDTQHAFDIQMSEGRIEYAKWFLCNASVEYGLTPDVYPSDLLDRLALLGGHVEAQALAIRDKKLSMDQNTKLDVRRVPSLAVSNGANLIGYAFGEFGMGEHVRMVARALSTTPTPFCVLDQGGGEHGAGDFSIREWVASSPKFDVNVFHFNADVFPSLCFKFEKVMFPDQYNIGYWAWELSKCPEEFVVALNIVDEVWAISNFVASSFKTRAVTSVVTMPLAVTVPLLDSSYTKRYYGLPENSFIFLFTFDSASCIDRKNPVAIVRAFKLAFPFGGISAHLVLKTMNIEVAGPMWGELVAEAQLDSRIIIITKRMSRNDVLGLNLACDAFISLHRSEGFGRCVAEAMAYGKPVIVTNYSGTSDFANERTACLVDFKLVSVPKGNYPFSHGQVWAEPDIVHAAEMMGLFARDKQYRDQIAVAGQHFIEHNFNETIIGARYAARLEKITAFRLAKKESLSPKVVEPVSDSFAGCIDAPTANAEFEMGDSLSIEGWVVSDSGIKEVVVSVGLVCVGVAHYGIIRPDIFRVHPSAPNAARSGYCFLLDTSNLAQGTHELKVLAKSHLDNVASWICTVTLSPATRYEKWLAKNGSSRIYTTGRQARKRSSSISLVVRTSTETADEQLSQTLASIKAQRLTRVDVILVATDSQRSRFSSLFSQMECADKLTVTDGASQNLMSLVVNCEGEVFSVIDAGNLLQSNTLATADAVFRKNRRADFIYGDEDRIHHGIRSQPIFKPGWSPILLDSYNYIGSAWFARTSLIRQALLEHECSLDIEDEHTLVFKLGQLSNEIIHVPSVFLSRSFDTGVVITEPFSSKSQGQRGSGGILPKVSIVIPTCLSDITLIEQCFHGITELTNYPDLEVIVVFNNVARQHLIDSFTSKWPFKFLHWDKAFSWSAINNFGASQASGEFILFMNDDVEALHKDWLEILVRRLGLTGAGAVGPLLKYPNGTVQHAGIYVNPLVENVRHFFRFSPGERARYHWLMKYPREVSAVTGACLLTAKICFDAVGGFDEDLPLVCNDTDYCFRLGAMGYPVLLESSAELVHHEGISRAGMSEEEDVARFKLKWKKVLKVSDPFSNPNIDTSRDDWSIDPKMMQEPAYRASKSRRKGTLK